jgi:hypothetical protein
MAVRTPTTTRPKASPGEVSINVNRLRMELQSAIADALQRVAQEEPSVVEARRGGRPPRPTPPSTGLQIQIWEDDPFMEAVAGSDPVDAQPLAVDPPEDNQPLQSRILDPEPAPGVYQPGTSEFLYWNAASSIARGINMWNPLLPNGTQWSTAHQPLAVEVDHKDTEDFNAFYARDSGLNFFHGTVDKTQPHVTVYSGESPDVVCHELGHAILDALKPELFDAMSIEVAAFHEAFGDMSATLCALQLPSMRQFVLEQTGGQLDTNSRLSQLARQLGWAIRVEFGPSAVDSDSLRNTCNRFFYQDPNGLPPSAPATQLSSEPHSFSRVFSGAFLNVLARMFHIGPASSHGNDADALEAIAIDAGTLLVEGIRLATVGAGYYSQVAASMIQADQTLMNGRYNAALTSSFVQRGILSPATAVALVRDLRSHGGQAFGIMGRTATGRHMQFDGDNEGYRMTGRDAPMLPLRPITTRFGVTLHLHLPAEPGRFGVTSAATTGGSERMYSPEEEARSFVEDLIQLNRVAADNAPGVLPAELMAPGRVTPCHRTHHLMKEDGKTVLKRHHFDCGFCRHRHSR